MDAKKVPALCNICPKIRNIVPSKCKKIRGVIPLFLFLNQTKNVTNIKKTKRRTYKMRKFYFKFYRTEKGKAPLAKFLSELSDEDYEEALNILCLLREKGHTLKRPFVKKIEGKLNELRTHSSAHEIRIFYFFHIADIIILIDGFIKKTQKTPKKEKQNAIKKMKDFNKREKKNDKNGKNKKNKKGKRA